MMLKILVMKLFSATLYDASRRWYLSLPDGSIKTMDRLEEAFLKRWSVKEDPNMLLTRLNNLAKYENESIQEFHTRFETLLQRIPASHHPKDDYLVHVYTRSFNGQLCCRLIHTWETWKKSSIHSVCPWGQVRVKVLSPNPQLLRLGQLLAKPRGVVPNKYTKALK
jgi:hypothetical protein